MRPQLNTTKGLQVPFSSKLFSTFALIALTASLIAVYVSPAAAATTNTCKPATNIEAIIDDSGSMSSTDYQVNRAAAIELFISKSGNAKKTLGALEFGSGVSYSTPPIPAATPLFAPAPIGPNAAAMKATLTNNLKADNGGTDYNGAFALAKTQNPNADARIFITDGGHNDGAYANGHQGGPPTYVLGLGIGPASATDEDATRLQTIANETAGVYYPSVDTSNIAATVNKVDAALSCQTVAKTFTDAFTKVGQTKSKAVSIKSGAKSVDLTMTWASPLDTFTISGVSLKTANGSTISVAKKRLKIKRSSGKTFLDLHIRGLKKGKLHFKLKSKTLGSGTFAGVNLTTQVVPSKRP
jgi:hypothetical protein